jgi:hypothetical protein
MLADSRLEKVEILALRRLLSAVSRGLAFEPEQDPQLHRAMVAKLYRAFATDTPNEV